MEEEKLKVLADTISDRTLIATKKVLTFDEALRYTGLSKSGLYKLTAGREIPHAKRGKHLYFDREELERWLMGNRVATNEELDTRAALYCMKNPRRPRLKETPATAAR